MLTQTAFRADQPRHFVSPMRNLPPAARPFRAGSGAGSLEQCLPLMGATMFYPRNTEIFGEGESTDYVYKVVSGSVRTYKILSDGRRQISGFYLPGDVFGLEFADEYAFSAEAVTDTKLLVVKRSTIAALAGRDAGIARELFDLTSRELRRMQARVLLLVKSAQERVASFLLEMAERASAGNIVELPMSRQDIADYLGLTIETVSRTLSGLESVDAIEVPTSRRIVLRNRPALNRLNS
jgi:CRP/FNR family transcriptional regulator, nitrogen fixation regulation protein